VRSALLAFTAVVCLCAAVGPTLGKAWPQAWILAYPCLFSIFYALGERRTDGEADAWRLPLRWAGFNGTVVCALLFTMKWVWNGFSYSYYVPPNNLLSWPAAPEHLVMLALAAPAGAFFVNAVRTRSRETALFRALPALCFAFYFYRVSGGTPEPALVVFNAYALALSLTLIRSGIVAGRLAAANRGILLLAALVGLRFFDSDIDFIFKGIVFLLLGAGFLTTNVVLLRKGGVR
jgi:hypothetical protein